MDIIVISSLHFPEAGLVLRAEVLRPPADADQVLGGDLDAVGLLVEARQRLQRVQHQLPLAAQEGAGRHAGRARGGGGGLREEVLARPWNWDTDIF